MKKENRIRKNEEFSEIISKKHSLASTSFVVYFDKRKEDHARAGISVSKKLGDAVTRNRIKRQVRMMMIQDFDFQGNDKDYILIVRKGYLEKSFDENRMELEKLIKKAIIRKHV